MFVVTGANGFIGSNLTLALRDRQNQPVAVVDDFSSVRYPDAIGDGPRIAIEALPDWLDAHADQIQGLYHLGACSDTTVTDHDYVMRVNFEYTRTLWNHCVNHRTPFVYASSAATYGDGSQGYDDTVDPARYQPLNLYGQSKHRFDLWALQQTLTPPRWAGVKYFNVYGPHEDHKGRMASMAYHWFDQIRETGQAKLFKSYKPGYDHGQQQRDFIYVRDAVDATIHLMTALDVNPGLYNIGTGQARCFADLATAVFTALKREPELCFIDMPDDLREQYQYFTQATVDKLRAAGFIQPMHSLEQGVEAYVNHRLHAKGGDA